jgi:hypothetical protein
MVPGIAKAVGREDRETRILHTEALTGISCTFVGRPISIDFQPDLSVYRGRILSGQPETGHAVHAACFLRKRSIILDSELRRKELTRILLHELFHFAWLRLSNSKRASYAELIEIERLRRARGELGWSAEWRKKDSSIPLRDYLCESFCDTGAWRYGRLRKHDEFTLARTWREKRREWFDTIYPNRQVPI